MNKNKSFFLSLLLAGVLMILSLPVQACDLGFGCGCGEPLDLRVEARVAYYHPSSKKIRKIYHDGWADYQIEVSTGFRKFGGFCLNKLGMGNFGFDRLGLGCWSNDVDVRLWAGVSGFSRKGYSIGFHDRTRLELFPVSLGLKFFYPIFCNTKVFIGGGASYSILCTHDHSDYVLKHVRKESWGGVIQSGLTYDFSSWGYVSAFADYYFQHFHFRNRRVSFTFDSYDSTYVDSGVITRHGVNLSGYKIGVGLGVKF